MATAKKESRYEALDKVEDFDLENDSDTTLASTGFLGKRGSKRLRKYSRASKTQTMLVWVRWGSIIAMQGVIVFLLLRGGKKMDGRWTQADTETGGDINGLYVPSKILKPFC
jgi:hypothetical protein